MAPYELNNVDIEFLPVKQLLLSTGRSRCVDAFALSVLKTERQARRLFTYLVYQSPYFDVSNVNLLRNCLAKNRNFNFYSSLIGIDMLSPVCISDLIGKPYQDLIERLGQIRRIRNKLFHGQVTIERHGRAELEDWISAMMEWTTVLAGAAEKQIGYDGYSFNSSYTKHPDPSFYTTLKYTLITTDDYLKLLYEAHAASLAK